MGPDHVCPATAGEAGRLAHAHTHGQGVAETHAAWEDRRKSPVRVFVLRGVLLSCTILVWCACSLYACSYELVWRFSFSSTSVASINDFLFVFLLSVRSPGAAFPGLSPVLVLERAVLCFHPPLVSPLPPSSSRHQDGKWQHPVPGTGHLVRTNRYLYLRLKV